MITGDIKQKVDAIWQTFWNSGFSAPITILEQLTYLLFMKMLDDKQLRKEANANRFGAKVQSPTFPEGMWHNPSTDQDVPYEEMRWSRFKNFTPEKMLQRVRNDVFVFLRYLGDDASAYSRAMQNTIFQITDARLLTRVVEGIENLPNMTNTDSMGDVYEYMLGKMAASGTNGQFRTPRHIIRMMVELMQPKLDDNICDPAMGSAGFIMEAAKYIHEHQDSELLAPAKLQRYKTEVFNGSDSDPVMMRIGCMNMMLHDVDQPRLHHRNSLSSDNTDSNLYSLILANPPFAGSLDKDDIANSLTWVGTKKTELLFLALFMRMLQAGGRCASIVPDTVLTGDNNAYRKIREELIDKHCVRAVITMPSGVFQPYSGVSTAIIIFTKTGTGDTENVWFYDMRADGYSLTTQRTPMPEQNDIPDIIARFQNLDGENDRTRKDQSFFVSADEIRENGYDLSYKKYHEVERETVEYEAPEAIIARMEERQRKIDEAFAEFKRLLNS